MSETTYQTWWQLHLRAARGETLDASQQAEYKAGLQAFDREEHEQLGATNLKTLRRLRWEVDQLQATHATLLAASVRLDRQISTLEEAPGVQTPG